jgi:hypothetical protein
MNGIQLRNLPLCNAVERLLEKGQASRLLLSQLRSSDLLTASSYLQSWHGTRKNQHADIDTMCRRRHYQVAVVRNLPPTGVNREGDRLNVLADGSNCHVCKGLRRKLVRPSKAGEGARTLYLQLGKLAAPKHDGCTFCDVFNGMKCFCESLVETPLLKGTRDANGLAVVDP